MPKESDNGMTDTDRQTALRRLNRPMRLTLAGLWAERLTYAFWPLWTVLIAALAALAFGVQDWLPIEGTWAGLVLAVLGGLWALIAGLRAFRRPSQTEAFARLDARLPGQPIAALNDDQALGTDDPASKAVWQAHLVRMAERAAKARAVEPNLRLARRDPFALRYVALTALVMALIFGSLWRVASVTGIAPGGASALATGPAWEGWAQPPAYTGKPALYLNDIDQAELNLPKGTRMQFRLYGEVGALVLTETVSASKTPQPASDVAQDFEVVQSGTINIEGPGGRDWAITALPDAPPTVALSGKIGREGDGRFTQAFSAADDYGVTSGKVAIALDLPSVDRRYGLTVEPEPREPVTLDLPMPITGDRAKFTETLIDDLSKHPFANLPVSMTFTVADAALQAGIAEPVMVTLPGKRFFDPLAAALIEARRDILWARSNTPTVVQVLKAVTNRPEGFIRNERAYLRLRVAMRRLDTEAKTISAASRDEIADELWEIALLVEEGDLASALERLRRAQDRLDEAIRNGADPSEVEQLMDEMRQALNEYMKQLAEEAERNPDQQTSENQPSVQMSQDQLQQMLDELQKMIDEGRMAEAAEMMEMLRQFMENMQVTQGEGQGQGQGGPGQQAMRELGDTLRDQQGLSDDAFRDLQNGQSGEEGEPQPGEEPGQDGQQPGQQGQQGQGDGLGTDGRSLAERQQDLRNRLGQLNDGRLPGRGSERGEAGRRNLDDAGRAMEEAERALRDGDLGGALDRQAEAMEALREGMRDLGEALAQDQMREGQAHEGEAFGQNDPSSNRDPLGRETGDSARIGSDRNMLQGKDVYRRAQDLLDEIRRRSGDQQRPEQERDYLKRLLDLF
jgi:uncharacterized protein (TIGR02302 family)